MPTTPIINAAGSLPYGQLATNINQFMTNQSIQPFLANLPGYAGMVGKRSENTAQMLSGQLPQDVVAQITQQAAERGIGGGAPVSPNSNAAFLRAIGLGSLDMQMKGSEMLSTSINDTPIPELWNPASLIIPQFTAAQELATVRQGQQAQQAAARNAAASAAWTANREQGNYRQRWSSIGGVY